MGLEHAMLGVYRAGSLKTVTSELGKYNLVLVAVQDVRWDRGGSQPADEYTFFYGSGNANRHIGIDFFLHEGTISAVIRV